MGTASDEWAERAGAEWDDDEDAKQSGDLPDQRLRHIHLDNRMPLEPTIAGIAAAVGMLRERVDGLADTADEIHELLDQQEPLDVQAEIVAHAHEHHWPVARCGAPCEFTAAAPEFAQVQALLKAHDCPHRTPPSLARLVVGCVTFIAVLIMILALVEELAGVK